MEAEHEQIERSNKNLHSRCNPLREGKTSAKSYVTQETKKSCPRHHALNCTKCPANIASSIKRQIDLKQRLQNKRDFSDKVKLFKGKNITSTKINQ